MEIILLERVENLGQMGDVVNVKNGYARNFLLPRKKALRATTRNRDYFDSRRKEIEAQNLEQRKEAESVAVKMDGTSCILIRQAGESGQLYGSVNSRDIAEILTEAGYKVNRQQIVLSAPIKSLGMHTVFVSLHPEVKVSVTINVARSAQEAENQVTAAAEEEAAPSPEDYFEKPELAPEQDDEDTSADEDTATDDETSSDEDTDK